MELREYGRVVWRRIWIVVALVAVVLVVSMALGRRETPSYEASLRFIVGVPPEPARGNYYTYDRYYTWLASEYLADDFSEVVKSAAFAANVSARLSQGTTPIQVPAGAIQGSTVAEKQHRILSMHITWGAPDQLGLIANAAADALQQDGSQYFSQLGEDTARVHVIDPPAVTPVPVGLRQKLDLPIRLALALLAGLFLAFLVDYLDDSVRDARELEVLDLPVLGTIPPIGGGPWPWSRRRRQP
jgi:capsular polysaccharide biosynthesis protein